MKSVAAKSAVRIAGWLIFAFIAVNVLAVVSPWYVLIRTVVTGYVLDHDLVHDVPLDGAATQRRDQVCAYWGGGNTLLPKFGNVGDYCPLFLDKDDLV